MYARTPLSPGGNESFPTSLLILDISVRMSLASSSIERLTISACDGETKAEIVIPLRILNTSEPVGVLDLDSTTLGTFDDDDLAGLVRIADILGEVCEWA